MSNSTREITVSSVEEFGYFNDTKIETFVDQVGMHWFPAITVADALDVSRSTITRIKTANEDQFTEGEEFMTIVIDGRNQLVFSEEGFLTVCDLSASRAAFHLRRWIRKQFRVKRDEAMGIVVYHKGQNRDDLSDVDPEFAAIQRLLDKAIDNRRRIRALEASERIISEQQTELSQKVEIAEKKIKAFEEQSVIKPGEMSALQLARHLRWVSEKGGAHNLAVILAAINANFHGRKLLRKSPVEEVNGKIYEQFVFTASGVTKFKNEIDSQYYTGQSFTIAPNEIAMNDYGCKHRRHVRKN